ncbi:MAG: radical SAM protein [Lentisphaerota bacterium]
MTKSLPRLIFHYLPPGAVEQPSAAFSIIKSFMESNGYKTTVNYWNILFQNIQRNLLSVSDLSDNNIKNDSLLSLSPFLYLISSFYKDSKAKSRISDFIKTCYPEMIIRDKDFFESYLKNSSALFLDAFKSELEKLPENQNIIHAFTARFDQWISAAVLSKTIKNISPLTPIIIGGFDSKEEALSVMKIVDTFDYAIWGEGEHSLLALCNNLKNNNSDHSNIKNLIFRANKELCFADSECHLEQTSFDLNSVSPDYEEYFDFIDKYSVRKDTVFIPLENGRGCAWNKCNFCFLNTSYKHRLKDNHKILSEIKDYSQRYGVFNYVFTGTDITSFKYHSFEKLLDGLIILTNESDTEFTFIAELIPKNISDDVIKKMSVLNFTVQIGYEAISDSILKKMNKLTRFSDLLLFLKRASKYGLKIKGSNILTRMPGENDSDIVESTNNLPYLRFFLGEQGFSHTKANINIKQGSNFYKTLPKSKEKDWCNNTVADLLPNKIIDHLSNRFHLFAYSTNLLKNENLWNDFNHTENHFEKNRYYYKVIRNGNCLIYKEFCNDRLVKSITFDDQLYIDILKLTSNSIESISTIKNKLTPTHCNLNEKQIQGCLSDLKKEYLLYYNRDIDSSIISTINALNTEQ